MPDDPAAPKRAGTFYRAAIGLVAVIGGLAVTAGLFFKEVPPGNKDALLLAIGIVLGWGGAVVMFEFGASSTGRKAAEQAIDAVTRGQS